MANNTPLPLSTFPQETITNSLTAMAFSGEGRERSAALRFAGGRKTRWRLNGRQNCRGG
ncbi:MAG: hypothetical protein HYY80_00090 [Chloroflexi bacterium]|nr:hypothetical protein [Chloroflexota bacterium]